MCCSSFIIIVFVVCQAVGPLSPSPPSPVSSSSQRYILWHHIHFTYFFLLLPFEDAAETLALCLRFQFFTNQFMNFWTCFKHTSCKSNKLVVLQSSSSSLLLFQFPFCSFCFLCCCCCCCCCWQSFYYFKNASLFVGTPIPPTMLMPNK